MIAERFFSSMMVKQEFDFEEFLVQFRLYSKVRTIIFYNGENHGTDY